MVKFVKKIVDNETTLKITEIDTLKLQTLGEGTLTVKGSIAGPFELLTGINSTGFTTVTAITKPGIYTFDMTGLNSIIINKDPGLSVIVVGVN